MSVAAMLRRSGSMTLLVYACHALFSTLLAWPLSRALASALAGVTGPRSIEAALTLETIARLAPRLLGWALACGLGYSFLSALLALAWLRSMTGADSVGANLRHALSIYPRALMLGAATLTLCGITAGLTAVGLQYLPALVPRSELAETAFRATVLSTGAGALLWIATLYDLARAALVAETSGALRSVSLALRSLSVSLLIRHLLISAGVVSCMLGAELGGRLLASHALVMTLAPQQALVFLATLLRAAWLAYARAAVNPRRCGSPALHAA